MSRKRISVQIKNNETNDSFETEAIINENCIKYREKDNTIVIFNKSNKELTRENNKLKMTFSFQKKGLSEGYIETKELNKKIKIMINTKIINIQEQSVIIDYIIEGNNFTYKMEVIE